MKEIWSRERHQNKTSSKDSPISIIKTGCANRSPFGEMPSPSLRLQVGESYGNGFTPSASSCAQTAKCGVSVDLCSHTCFGISFLLPRVLGLGVLMGEAGREQKKADRQSRTERELTNGQHLGTWEMGMYRVRNLKFSSLLWMWFVCYNNLLLSTLATIKYSFGNFPQ